MLSARETDIETDSNVHVPLAHAKTQLVKVKAVIRREEKVRRLRQLELVQSGSERHNEVVDRSEATPAVTEVLVALNHLVGESWRLLRNKPVVVGP